jgi:hypothetical protein
VIRAVDAARLATGLTVLARPDLAVRLTGSYGDRATRRVIRILGARYVLQAVAATGARSRWSTAADAAVDLVHAASMGPVAYLSLRHRRLATTSGVLAVLFAAGDLATASKHRQSSPEGSERP